MKTLIALLLVVLTYLPTKAQDVCNEIRIDYLESSDAEVDALPILKWKDGYLAWGSKKNEISVGFANKEMKFEELDVYNLNTNNEDFIDLNIINGEIVLIVMSGEYNKSKKNSEYQLSIIPFETETMQFGEPKMVHKVIATDKDFKFDVTISENEEFILVNADIQNKKEKQNGYDFVVLDRELQLVWKRKIIWQGKGFIAPGVWDQHFTNSGDLVLIVGTRSFSNPEYFKKDSKMYIYTKDQENPVEVEDIDFNIKGKDNIYIDHSNGDFELFYDGLVKDDNVVYGGVRISSETHKVVNETLTPISLEMQTLFLDDKEVKDVKSKVSRGKQVFIPFSYHYKDIIIGADGSLYLIYERLYSTQSSISSPVFYYGDNIKILKFSKNREFEWASEIEKDQLSRNCYWCTGHILVELSNGNLGFIYNAVTKYDMNTSKDDMKIFYSELDILDGEMNQCLLINSTEENCYFNRSYYSILEGELYLEFQRKDNKEKRVLLTFD